MIGHKTFLTILLICLWRIQMIAGAAKFQCPRANQTTFDKKVATRPVSTTSFSEAVFTLRQNNNSPQSWSPLECLRQCMGLQECHSVLVLHQNQVCYGLPYIETNSLHIDNDANYFIKQCLDVPESCSSKLWAIESLNGFRLLSFDSVIQTVPDVTNDQCSRLLLTPTQGQQITKSAQFQLIRPSNSYNGYAGNQIDFNVNTIGKCILSREDKFTEPESFRVAGKESWYKENQCIENMPKEINRCSYEEYYNQTLKHYDVILHGISTSECKSRCENERQFNCRGFTTVPLIQGRSTYIYTLGVDDNSSKSCLLHSEDVLTHGSWLLVRHPGAVYYRRVTCLNVTVVCTPSAMLISYMPRSNFRGRIYASGHSDTCSAAGQGKGQPTKLIIPFNEAQQKCGINQAFAVTDDGNNNVENKTLIYTLLVIQNNPIIQAQGDRFVRVGCVASPSYNLTLGADISVGNDSTEDLYNTTGTLPQTIPAASIINTTAAGVSPKVRMYIINEPEDIGQYENGKIPGGSVGLGENIELRIETESPNFEVDIMAYHLVASSQLGDSSVLLLDSRGCPTGQVDFPALVHSKIPARPGDKSGIVRLSARFRAFRFPNSHVIKFSVMVQFCPGLCEEIVCDTPRNGPVRNAREVKSDSRPFDGFTVESVATFNPYSPDISRIGYEDANIKIVDNINEPPRILYPSSNESSRNPYIVVASTENAGRVMEICKEIKESKDNKIPLELSLIVASNDAYSADSLIYGENNKILVAAVGDPKPNSNNMICIHEALFIAITFIWLLVQVIILAACMIVIKRYRNFVEDGHFQKDYHSFDNLGFDSFSTRRVHWPDQPDTTRS